jgi:hypothetical protein
LDEKIRHLPSHAGTGLTAGAYSNFPSYASTNYYRQLCHIGLLVT